MSVDKPDYASKKLWKEYSKISMDERRCLSALAEKLFAVKSLAGKRVILNCHLTRSTLIIIDALRAAGAEVHVTASPYLVIHPDALATIKKAKEDGVSYIPYDELSDAHRNNFDIAIDCGAALLDKIKPKSHAVELTHTSKSSYTKIDYPVISVDISQLKAIETYFGTSDGFIRIFNEILSLNPRYNQAYKVHEAVASMYGTNPDTQNDKASALERAHQSWFKDRKYMIFGFGKVGKGIAKRLVDAGVKPCDIIIVDILKDSLSRAKFLGYTQYPLIESKEKIKETLQTTYCVVTATGVENCISQNFEKADFSEVKIKVNMGTPDEWGQKFPAQDIVNDKKPANFTMPDPTRMIYLDPIFTALIRAAELSPKNVILLGKGLQPLPETLDRKIIQQYRRLYGATQLVEALNVEMLSPGTQKELSGRSGENLEGELSNSDDDGTPLSTSPQSAGSLSATASTHSRAGSTQGSSAENSGASSSDSSSDEDTQTKQREVTRSSPSSPKKPSHMSRRDANFAMQYECEDATVNSLGLLTSAPPPPIRAVRRQLLMPGPDISRKPPATAPATISSGSSTPRAV